MGDLYDLDYDLGGCIEHNPQDGITAETVAAILAVHEGENDGDDWRWVLALTDGRFAFVQGGADYTGWDCQSWATSAFADTAEGAARFALGEETPLTGDGPETAGMGHMLALVGGTYMDKASMVYESFVRQVAEGKAATWRETKDAEFGVTSGAR